MNARMPLIFILAVLLVGCVTTGSGGSSDFVRAADKSPPKVDPKAASSYETALISMRAGNTSRAEKQFIKLTKDHPGFSGPHNNLGILYYREGNIENAQSAFEEALKVNSESVVSLNYMGIISREKGEFKQAQGFYEKALEADPNYAYAHLNYGILLELYMGKMSDALKHYKRYQELTVEEDKKVKGWIIELSRRVKN